jgi:amino acid adenylation domain-containing protein
MNKEEMYVLESEFQGFRLSPQQRRLWALQRVETNSPYRVRATVLLEGPVDPTTLKEALHQTMIWHEVLRTTIRPVPGMDYPVQVIQEDPSYTFTNHDLSDSSASDREAAVRRLWQETEATAFDLAQGPLVNASLLTLSPSEHVFHLCLPALCTDETGLVALVRELANAYASLTSDEHEDRDALQYADISEVLNNLLESEETAAGRSYWAQQDTGGSTAAKLIFNDYPDRGQSFTPQSLDVTFDPAQVQRIHEVARSHDVSVANFLQACWHVLLWKVTKEEVSTVGTAFSGRVYEGLDSVPGLFVRYLPISSHHEEDHHLREVLDQLRPTTNEASEQQDYFNVERLHSPHEEQPFFFPLSFEFVESHQSFQVSNLRWTLSRAESCTDRFMLKLRCVETEGSLRTEFHYDRERVAARTVERLARSYRTLVLNILQQPNARLGELEILDEEQRHEVLVEFNQTATTFEPPYCIHEAIEKQSARTPEQLAVVFGQERLTYSELDVRTNQLARDLRGKGVKPETLVGVLFERSIEMMVGLVGVLKAGAAYLPLDPEQPPARLKKVIDDSQPRVLLIQDKFLPLVDSIGTALEVVCLDSNWSTIATESPLAIESGVRPANVAYVIYTSGSTGRPKGVAISHAAICNRLLWMQERFPLCATDRVLQKTVYNFDASVWELFLPLMSGAVVVLAAPGAHRDSAAMVAAIKQEAVTVLQMVPSMLAVLVEEPAIKECVSLQRVFSGGEALTASLQERFAERVSWANLINLYGPTEASIDASYYACEPEVKREKVIIGRPISNTQLYLLDQQQQPVPVGTPGELYIGGVGLARGYLRQAGLTAERFVPNEFGEEDGLRLYRTGDLGRYLSDGNIEYLGRLDHQVKVRGFRIELGEIESTLSNHPAVRQNVVIAREDVPGEKRLVAYIVPAGSDVPTNAEWREVLKEKLPDYMIPAAFEILDALPLTPNGKLDRKRLPSPAQTTTESKRNYVAPRTPIEETLTNIWAEVLKLERVGIHDNFFELGGDSIRSIQVKAAAQRVGLEFSLEQLFGHQSVYELAQELKTAQPLALMPTKTEPFSLISAEDRSRMPATVEDAYPLTMLQSGMLFHREYSPHTAIYHDLSSFHLRGQVDIPALETAVKQLAARHSILRTAFDLTSFSEPLQLVYQSAEIPLQVVDLRWLSEAEQKRALEDWMETQKMRVFDSSCPPLMRFTVHRRSEETIQFTMNCHHAILDGWSVAAMISELFQLYFIASGKPASLPAPPSPSFSDFVALERKALESEVCADYWMQKLSDHVVLTLPRWRESMDAAVESSHPLLHEVRLTNEVSEGLRRLSRVAGVPMKSVLLAAHLRVMSLVGGQTDVLTGVVTNCRLEESDGERALGLFLNTLPFRQQLSGGEWIDLVRETFASEIEVLPHRWFPLAEMQRRLGGQHLFETVFNFIHFHIYESVSAFSEIQPLSADTFEQTNHTLTASFSLEVPSLQVNLSLLCDSTQLDEEQVKVIAGYYVKTLEAMANEPRQRYEQSMLISDHEQQQLLVEWNQTAGNYELVRCLHERIEAQAASTPEAVAVTFEHRSLSYRQLNTRANELAQHLRTFGVGPEMIVGVLMERSLEMMIGLLAILKAGAAYLPLDPEQPSERLSLILDDARPPVLLTQEVYRNRLQRDGLQVVCVDSDWRVFGLENVENVRSGVRPANVAYVIYTSGSTGRPKGVAISHAAICNRLLWMQERFPLCATDRVLQKTVYNFDASVWELFLPLMSGAVVVLAAPGAHRDSAAMVAAIKQEAVTVLQMVPSMLAVLVEEPAIKECVSLQRVFSGGEALTASLQERFAERVSWANLINLYGPTEASIDASYYACEPEVKREKVIIGRPISNTQLYLLDQQQQPVPVGTPGELYIGGVGLARGYLRQAGLTAERFVPNEFGEEDGLRLYRTGDLGRYLSDGNIEYLGRLDHQVKVRGFRIELGEIESTLLKQPGVRDAVVLARDDDAGEKRLVAYVVASDHEGAGPSAEELRRALRDKLPDYMVPQAFVSLEQLPLLPNAKVNLRALPEPEFVRQDEKDYVAPRTPTEDIVAGIWANALRLAKVSADDNFFALGGHSLLATQVVSRIRQVFQIELPLRTLFEQPTVCALSRSIDFARSEASNSPFEQIEPVSRESNMPLSFSQQRLWFVDQLEPGSAAYNVASAIRLEGNLNVAALQQSFDTIVGRHEALRTTFTTVNGHPVQVIGSPQPVSLQITDLRDLSASERASEMRLRMNEEAQRPFDLARGPLLRVLLLQLGEDEYVMLLTLHHIVTDGWSLGVLVRDLSTLYEAFSRGESPELPDLPIQYADFAAWQRKWLQGEVLDAQLDYWKQQLADAPAVVELPTDQPRPVVQTSRGVNHHSHVEENTTSALRVLSHREAASLFMTLLAAFKVLVSRYTRQDHIVVGTDVANRNRHEIEGLIGFFANQLVLHTDLSGNPTFRELLRRVRELMIGAYAHQDLPFEKLVEELGPERDSSRTPLFQLKIVMQNAPLPVIELDGLHLFAEELGGGTSKFDLTLFLEDTPKGLSCTWQYNSELFAPRTIRRLATQFAELLEQIAREPDSHLRELTGSLDQRENEERLNEKMRLKATNFEKFKSIKPNAVNQ